MKQILYILTIILIVVSCDCRQQVNGLIVDQNTEYEIGNVQIWKTSQQDLKMITDSSGYFEYTSISGGLFKCPDIQLNFEKKGYKLKTFEFKSFSTDTFIIYLEKDFDFSKIRKSIIDTLIKLEKANCLTSDAVGYEMKTPEIWYTRQWFTLNANQNELLLLTDYPNPIIKAIAFEGLYRIGYMDLFQVLLKNIENGNELIDYSSGCEGEIISLGEFCFCNIMKYRIPPNPPFRPDSNAKIKFTDDQKKILIELLKNGG